MKKGGVTSTGSLEIRQEIVLYRTGENPNNGGSFLSSSSFNVVKSVQLQDIGENSKFCIDFKGDNDALSKVHLVFTFNFSGAGSTTVYIMPDGTVLRSLGGSEAEFNNFIGLKVSFTFSDIIEKCLEASGNFTLNMLSNFWFNISYNSLSYPIADCVDKIAVLK